MIREYDFGDIPRRLFMKLGVTPGQLWEMTPHELFAAVLQEEQEPKSDPQPGTLAHLLMVNAKLTAEGKPPSVPRWWPSVKSFQDKREAKKKQKAKERRRERR